MSEKLFSIIMPTLNCGHKLEATINSVLSQNRELTEFIIVDGDSADETSKVINEYKDDLSAIIEPDEGTYDAMNKGIDVARGKYLYFLGAGDTLRAGILEEIAGMMPTEPLSFVYGDVYRHDLGTRYRGEFSKATFRRYNICHQAIFYERTIFELLGKYEQKYSVMADYVFNMRCFADPRVQVKYLNRIIADFEGYGLSQTKVDVEFEKDRSRLIKNYLGTKHCLLFYAERNAERAVVSFARRCGVSIYKSPTVTRRD